LDQYSIADFLEAMTNDNLEKKVIRLISEGHFDEALLTKILEEIGRKQE
jgi:Mor family transcriptional regulator